MKTLANISRLFQLAFPEKTLVRWPPSVGLLGIFFTFHFLLAEKCRGQDLSVLSPLSAEGQSQHYQMSSTVGEPIIWTGGSAQVVVTQGFQQPDYNGTVPVEKINPEQWHLRIFPNPAQDFLNVQFLPLQREAMFLEVHDLAGRLIVPAVKLPEGGFYQLALVQLPAGGYAIRFFDDGKKQTVFQFQIVR